MRKPAEFVNHPYPFPDKREYPAVCKYVSDGDTYDFFIDQGLYDYAYSTIRIQGIDTAEIYRAKSPEELEEARRAKAFVQGEILGKGCLIRTYKDRTSHGRFKADVIYKGENGKDKNLLDELDAAGFRKKEFYVAASGV